MAHPRCVFIAVVALGCLLAEEAGAARRRKPKTAKVLVENDATPPSEAPPPATDGSQAAPTSVPTGSAIDAVEAAFADSYFEDVEVRAVALIESPQSSSEERERARHLLWRAQFYIGKAEVAKATLHSLLASRPELSLDPAEHPPALLEFFNQARATSAPRHVARRSSDDLPRQLRGAATASLIVGSASLAAAAGVLIAGQLISAQLALDITRYNEDAARTSEQQMALRERSAQAAAFDVSFVALAAVGVVGVAVGVVLFVSGSRRSATSEVQVSGVAIGPGRLVLQGTF